MNNYLYINKANIKNIILKEPLAYENDLLINRIWYSADADLIEQVFKKTINVDSGVSMGRFWSAIPTGGLSIRKIHAGLPQTMVNVLSDLIISDMGDVKINDVTLNELWSKIEEDEDFKDLIQEAITNTLVDGDGAFKIHMDPSLSDYPIVTYYSGSECETEWVGNKAKKVIFYNYYTVREEGQRKDRTYTLKEIYSPGKIIYELYDDKDKLIPLDSIEETAALIPNGYKGDKMSCEVTFNYNKMLAVPMRFWKSTKYKNRGKSLYDSKTECFDRLDEAISAFADYERDNRTKNYIPEDLIPRDPEQGEMLKPNPFNFRYIKLAEGVDLSSQQIQSSTPDSNYQAHVEAINSALDQCLLGIVSPATLGINIAANSSGESQKEKKDITAITRNHITDRLEKIIRELVKRIIIVATGFKNDDFEVDFNFGEYAALDFGSKIAIMATARPGQAVMSAEAAVEELWGDSKDEEWKQEEIKRLKEGNEMFEEVPFPDDNNIETDEEIIEEDVE